jgi:tetratricopeptide (TPR) repeat protein
VNASVVGSGTAAPVVGETVSAPIRGNAAAMAPRFAVRGVLARPVLDGYLARVAARPDASFPGMSELIGRARSGDIARLNVSEAQAVQTPIAAFVRGLTLLAQNKLDPAAAAFRSAMRASTDFYPAMVYLGACYAAAGNDKEAAAIWRTALIKEGGAPEVHLLLADALLRQGSSAMALQVVNAARLRWPEDNEIRRRFVLASIMAGNDTAGLQALDELVQQGADDEATLSLGLLTLYGSISKGRSIEGADQDRARLLRLAQAYRTRGGASLPLVETWVAAVKQGQLPVPK